MYISISIYISIYTKTITTHITNTASGWTGTLLWICYFFTSIFLSFFSAFSVFGCSVITHLEQPRETDFG